MPARFAQQIGWHFLDPIARYCWSFAFCPCDIHGQEETKHNRLAPFIIGETFYWIGNHDVSSIESIGDLTSKVHQRILD
jgi:hypothetical protein